MLLVLMVSGISVWCNSFMLNFCEFSILLFYFEILASLFSGVELEGYSQNIKTAQPNNHYLTIIIREFLKIA